MMLRGQRHAVIFRLLWSLFPGHAFPKYAGLLAWDQTKLTDVIAGERC
jgi:hypothetical protein